LAVLAVHLQEKFGGLKKQAFENGF